MSAIAALFAALNLADVEGAQATRSATATTASSRASGELRAIVRDRLNGYISFYTGGCRDGQRASRYWCTFRISRGDTSYRGKGSLTKQTGPLRFKYHLAVAVYGCDDSGCGKIDEERWRGVRRG